MKAVTEFSNFTLNQALKTKANLSAEGKTPEEIQENLGTTFKLEGEKLGYFVNALEVVGTQTANLKRVVVMRLNEGESAPAKGTQVGDLCYVPEFISTAAPKAVEKSTGRGGRPNRGGPGGGRGDSKTKSSPWGMTPEEKAAKKGKAVKA